MCKIRNFGSEKHAISVYTNFHIFRISVTLLRFFSENFEIFGTCRICKNVQICTNFVQKYVNFAQKKHKFPPVKNYPLLVYISIAGWNFRSKIDNFRKFAQIRNFRNFPEFQNVQFYKNKNFVKN